MFHKVFRAALLVILLTSFSAHATLIKSLPNLDIDGTKYNVTFHDKSFNALFDKDGDGQYNDNDGSIFNRAPIFFGNKSAAESASIAIIGALGKSDWTKSIGPLRSDVALVPYRSINIGSPSNPYYRIDLWRDGTLARTTDANIESFVVAQDAPKYTTATFERVPTPSTIALASLALGIMGVMGRRRRAC